MKNIILLSAFFLAVALCPANLFAQPGYITTIAGNGTYGFSGDGGAATAARIGNTYSTAIDGSGNIYLSDISNQRIRKINLAGIINTIGGGGASAVDGIPATNASLNLSPRAPITTDAAGNIFFVESNKIRKITATTGIISTVAGTGIPGFSGDGGPAILAQVDTPGGLCFDVTGNLYLTDDGTRVRKISAAGTITTYAGTGTNGFWGDGGAALSAQFSRAAGLCIDGWGNIYIADQFNSRIRKIDASGLVSTYCG